MGMANEIEQLEYAILLIKQNGKDYLDERDIPILETAIDTMRKYQKIEAIVNSPVFIQEDVIRYKMICEILGSPRP